MSERVYRSHDGQRDPALIGETLENYLSYLGAPPIRTLQSLHERWSEIVGPALSEPTRPIELVDGVLVVGCDDGTWASQVQWMEAQILRRFRELFAESDVRKISIRVGG